jgi:hypothetical protein
MGRKISNFPANTALPADSELTLISGGVNYKIALADFLAALNVTGSIVQDGAVTSTPILDIAGTINNIRNIEDGSGIKSSVSPENGVTLEHNFIEDTSGVGLVVDLTADQPKFRSLIPGTGINVSATNGEIQIALSAIPVSTKTVIVNQLSDFPTAVGGVITLADDTEYAIRNDITTSNRFVLGSNTVLDGSDNIVITLTYSGSGIMFTSVDKSWTIKDITINCASGIFIDFDGTSTEIIQLKNSIIIADILGTIDDFNGIHLENTQFQITTNGFLFGGSNGVTLVESAFGSIDAGTLFDLGIATFSSFSVTGTFVTLNGASIFLDGAASSANITAGNLGAIHNSRFFGTGTILQTISENDIRWEFATNNGIVDTHKHCLMSQTSNVVATAISVATTPVKLAGTWVEEHSVFFETDATGKITYIGEKDIEINVDMSFSAAPVSGTNKSINFYVAKNGTHITNSRAYNNMSSGDPTRTTLLWMFTLSPNDYVEAFVANDTDTIDVLISDAVLRLS